MRPALPLLARQPCRRSSLGTGSVLTCLGAAAQAKVDYMDLPTPIKYEEIQREAMSARHAHTPPPP
jgi:hypothetical protein